jgi:hypothetical protein
MNIELAMEGGCACGGVRYRLDAAPMVVHACHCRWCQRETGTAFAQNAVIETDRVMLLQGDLERIDTPSESGKGQLIVRCGRCHVAVWSHYAGMRDKLAFVRVGTLDEPGRLQPDIHIYTASKQPWVVLPPGATAVPEFYNLPDYWPSASLDRIAALRK